jgi:hypothetical protein
MAVPDGIKRPATFVDYRNVIAAWLLTKRCS